MTDKNKNCQLVMGNLNGRYEIALIMKITFDINSAGVCTASDEQLPIVETIETYDDGEFPDVSAISADSDLYPFKPGTDVVVQGHAYSYNPRSQSVEAKVEIEDTIRTIRVHGDRQLAWHNGKPIFTDALTFESMPLRFEKAYGGYDPSMDVTEGEFTSQVLAERSPDERWDTATRQYYPRNPSGSGYLASLNQQSSEGLVVPNLEYLFDEITPNRLAIGQANHWMRAPLPAAFDWVNPAWFPRIAYFGLTPEYEVPKGGVQEINHGWATPNLLEHRSVVELQLHPTFQHGASACLIRKRLQPSTRLRLSNLFPNAPEKSIQLSPKTPKAQIHLSATTTLETESHLGSVVVQPDNNRVVEVWSARAEVSRPFGPNELDNMTWKIQWD